MENFWNKIGLFAIGVTVGGISGVLSAWQLTLGQAMFRPAIIFGVISVIYFRWILPLPFLRLLVLFISLQAIYFIVLLVAGLFTGMYVVGAALLFVAVMLIYRLNSGKLMLASIPLFAFVGAFLDFSPVWLEEFLRGDRPPPLLGEGGIVSDITQLAIMAWQMIAIGVISLQLHAERRYRQRLAAQEATEGGAPEP